MAANAIKGVRRGKESRITNEKRLRVAPEVRQRARELRQPQTPAERLLWQHLCGRQLNGLYFRRQHPIGRFIVDFCCTRQHLIIELDGNVHVGQEEYDSARTDWLEAAGYRVIRFTNDDVFHRLSTVLAEVLAACQDQAVLPPTAADNESAYQPNHAQTCPPRTPQNPP